MNWFITPNLRSFLILPGLVMCLLFTHTAHSDTSVLPLAKNLQALGKQANQQNLPIAILFSAKGLKSTQNLKDDAILPTLYSGALDGFVIMREIHVNIEQNTLDFYGQDTPNEEFKAIYNLTSLPVMIFVNGEGDEITEPLLSGAYDYYPFFLKQSINSALKELGNSKQIAD